MADEFDPLALLLGQNGATQTGQPAPPPAPVATAPPAPASDVRSTGQRTWSQYLSEPANRAFLISAGAQMMQPSWGGALGNLGMAMAQGEEARSGTLRTQQDMDLTREQMDTRSREASADRANRLRVAEIGAESRIDVAGLRSNAMLERARLIGARGTAGAHQFSNLTQRFLATLTRDNPVAGPGKKSPDQLFEQALTMAEEAMRRQNPDLLAPSSPAPVSAPGAPVTSPPPGVPAPPSSLSPPGAPPSAPVSPPSVPGENLGSDVLRRIQSLLPSRTAPTIPPTAAPAPPSTVAPAPPAPNTTAGSTMSWEQFISHPRSRDLLRSPQSVQRLLAANPSWAAQINAERRRMGLE